MSKAVLMSIKPYYCEMIFRGEKTIEIRKRAPKLKPPFKLYVYCTNDPDITLMAGGPPLNGFVIGEFVCDSISHWPLYGQNCGPDKQLWYDIQPEIWHKACLTYGELLEYGAGGPLYGLHISRPRLYLKPKELSRFMRPCPKDLYCESCAMFSENRGRCFNAALQITRPPQSWCYVEEWYFNE